jgi:UDP-N-acetylglucosamine:LPS N-acetylglucosamine transferase
MSAVDTHKDVIQVRDADLSSKLKLVPLAIQIFAIMLRYRPDFIISTGAAPGFFAIVIGKLMGAKTIWVDSMANSSKLSVSGRHASRYCDLFLTQWPSLAQGDKVRYFGSLL